MSPNESSGNDEEILFQARVEDFTTKFFDEFDKNVDKVAKKTEEGFGKVNDTVKTTGSSMAILAGVVGGVATSVFTKLADKALELGLNLVEFGRQSEQLAERLESTATSLKVVGENSGISMLALKGLTDEMGNVGLTTSDSREALIKMIQSEMDLKKSAELTGVAMNASAVGGTTPLRALESMIQAITYQSPRLLRTLGIVVDFQAEFKKAAADLGRELTDMEKKQISLNAVLEQGKKIEGAYAESLKTAQGQRIEQAKLIEDIQEQIGKMFTPAVYESLKSTNEILQEILDYLSDNKDNITELSDDFVALMIAIKKIVVPLLELYNAVNSSVTVFGLLNKAIGLTSDPFELLTTVITGNVKAMAIAAGGVAVYTQSIENMFTVISTKTKQGLGSISTEEATRILKSLPSIKAAGDEAISAVMKPLLEHTTTLDNVTEATDNAAESAKNLAEVMAEKLKTAVEEANIQLKKLKETQDLAAAEREIKATRTQIENELRLQWDREDQERAHNERIQQILDGAEEQKTNLAKQAADARLQIEEDYRKRLTQLLDDYNYEASELARRRDAVGMLALARKYKRDVNKEKEAQDERRAEISKSYQKTIEDLDKSLKDQLDKAEKARTKELETYQRSLDRQAELKKLHDQWEEEDRQRQLNRTLETMVKGFAAMDGMTQEGLNKILSDWGIHFSQLAQLISANAAAVSELYKIGTAGVNLGIPLPRLGTGGVDVGIQGQAGIVSDLLMPESMKMASKIGQIPSVRPSSVNYDKREIHVTVDGNALDPYIQRKVVNTLMEIERNRGK
jgi:hypothetical protein